MASGVDSWRQGVTPVESDSEEVDAAPDWRDSAASEVLHNSSRRRLACLKELAHAARSADAGDRQVIVRCLVSTVAHYVDGESRKAALRVLKQTLERAFDESTTGAETFPALVKWLQAESARVTVSLAPASRFNLLCWICEVFGVAASRMDGFVESKQWPNVLVALSTLIQSAHAFRPSMRRAAVAVARRCVRQHANLIPAMLDVYLKGGQQDSIVLGIIIGVAIRLRTGDGRALVHHAKQDISTFYLTHCLGSRPPAPETIVHSFDDFIATFIDAADLDREIRPTLERLLVRQPEAVLPSAVALFQSYAFDTDGALTKMLTQLGTLARSVNSAVRQNTVDLFRALVAKASTEVAKAAGTDLAAPLRTGRTASAENRATIFAMLAVVPPDPQLLGLALTSKEASRESSQTIVRHLPAALQDGLELDLKTSRKGVLSAIGDALWSMDVQAVDQHLRQFTDALVPLLDVALKNATASPSDAYVAIALCKRLPSLASFASNNATLNGLFSTGVKPSGLFSPKAYQKLADSEEELWLLRALSVALRSDGADMIGDGALCAAAAQPFIYLAADGKHHASRRSALQEMQNLTNESPVLAYGILLPGLRSWLLQEESRISNGDHLPVHSSRLTSVLATLLHFGASLTTHERHHFASRLVVVANHPHLRSATTSLWIELLVTAGIKPESVVRQEFESMLTIINQDAPLHPASPSFLIAARRALTDIVLVGRQEVLPSLVEQVLQLLDPQDLAALSDQDVLIWQASGDDPVVDVLSVPRVNGQHLANGKDAAMLKWDDEQRQALAKKKSSSNAPRTLSKADRSLVDAQLSTERHIRQQVSDVFAKISRGLGMLHSILATSGLQFAEHVPSLLAALIKLSKQSKSSYIASEIFATFTALANVCLRQLQDLIFPLTTAILRISQSPVVPENFEVEQLDLLVLRILYRLRSLAETGGLLPTTFQQFATPLFSMLVEGEGLNLNRSSQAEARVEQLQLVIDFIGSQTRAAADICFPRVQTIAIILGAFAASPQFSKAAATALMSLGENMEDTAAKPEKAALLMGAMVEEAHVRLACLQALQVLDLTDRETSPELWLLCHDEDERNTKYAWTSWDENAMEVTDSFLMQLLPYLGHHSHSIRGCAARAIAAATHLHPHRVHDVLAALVHEYNQKNAELVAEYDRFGMLVESSLGREDPWRTRAATASAIAGIADLFDAVDVNGVFSLLIEQGALGDRHAEVRAKWLEAGNAMIDLHGHANLNKLMHVFEQHLEEAAQNKASSDHITESVIVLFGRLARHLEPLDPRMQGVIARLIDALKTPSEDVQAAVSECLPPLIKASKEEAPRIIDDLLRDSLHALRYAERRGAAYGLAGAVKGRGISSLKDLEVIARIREAIEDKKDSGARQGAIFAIELLSITLGRIFEPYVIQVLPLLLQTFGDAVADVRSATQDASRSIMSKISGHAVKLILPSLLAGLDDRQWRSKKGAIELIGTMAFLAPRQLSLSLPTILPRLTEVLTDTHAQVRSAANASLKQFGEVISNPEVKGMQSTLLDALIDPTRKNGKALDAILGTSFSHFIDNSSLALIIPILDRGIRERSSESKRKSAQIVGTLANITEARDLTQYLSQLVPRVREVLIDPVPEVRATAAQALGGLVERLGEEAFPGLMESLLQTLSSETTGIDQQGAAQGLSEILAGLAIERLEELLPDIISQTRSSRAYIREGFVSLLVFLPVTFGERFSPYLGRIIEPVLAGLADESDYVREASLKAGRMIVSSHSTKAISILLPELEKGLFDRNHRIRHSSMQLVGELLFKVSGISGKAELAATEEDEDIQATPTKVALVDILGRDRRDRVLAAVFIVRQDSSGPVRQLAVNVWKALVSNTPRTVREVLPVLIQIIVRQLAAEGSEQRECAARALGDLCRKMGESVLLDLMPVLHHGAKADDRTRQGVQLALTEILAACPDSQIGRHEEAIVAAVRTALIDGNLSVRGAAALAFDALQRSIGPRAIDKVVPVLLETLRNPGASADAALAALQEVMSVRADKIVPVLIPTLIKTPMTAFNARALASLVGVAGKALSRRLSDIIDALEQTRISAVDDEIVFEIDEAIKALFRSISDDDSLSLVQLHLLSLAKNPAAPSRCGACRMLATLSRETQLDMGDYHIDWVRVLLSLFDDRDHEVVKAAWTAMDTFVTRIPKDELENLAPPLRRSIETTGVAGVPLPGFELGLKPVLPILVQGLLAGTAEQREQSAYAMGDIVERISLDALKPHVTQMAGPLIRIIAERFPAPVRAAILHSLTILVGQVPSTRPFYPQIQRTFSKSLADPLSLAVRSRAANGLGVLMAFQPRIDPLIAELITGATTSESSEVRESFLDALARVVQSGGKNMTSVGQSAVFGLVQTAFESANTTKGALRPLERFQSVFQMSYVRAESTSAVMARVFAAMTLHFSARMKPLIESQLLNPAPASQLASLCLRDAIETAPEALFNLGSPAIVAMAVVRTAQIVDNPAVARPAREARELLRVTHPFSDDPDVQHRL